MKIVSFLCIIFLFTSCATTNIADMTKYNDTNYPPKDDNYEMLILDRDNIENEFIVIGEVRDKLATIYDSEEQIIKNLKTAAKKMGGER